jgi:hypothetical protein
MTLVFPAKPPHDPGYERARRGEILHCGELMDEAEMLIDKAKTVLHLASGPERFTIKVGDDFGVPGKIGARRFGLDGFPTADRAGDAHRRGDGASARRRASVGRVSTDHAVEHGDARSRLNTQCPLLALRR